MGGYRFTLALALVVGCASGIEEARVLPDVEFVCDEILDGSQGPTCELVEGRRGDVRVWLPGAVPLVSIDGVLTAPAKLHEIDGGWRLTIQIPDGAGTLQLRRPEPNPGSWRMAFAWKDPIERPPVHDTDLSRAYQEARWRDCVRLASTAFSAALVEHRPKRALEAARTGTVCGSELGDFDVIQQWLIDIAQIPAERGYLGLTRSQIEFIAFFRHGALQGALGAVDSGLLRSERLGFTDAHSDLLSYRSLVLAELGDFVGALAAAREALDRDAHPNLDSCGEAELRLNLSWALLESGERTGIDSWGAATEELQRALGLVETRGSGCSPDNAPNIRLNLARVSLLRGDAQAALSWLDGAASAINTSSSSNLRAELRLLRIRAGLAAGGSTAVDEARSMTDAESDLLPDLRLELIAARGALAESEKDLLRARDEYSRAHIRALERLGKLAHNDGIQRFLFDRRPAAQRLVTVLHALGDSRAALRVARETASAETRLLAHRRSAAAPSGWGATARRAYLGLRAEEERVLGERWDLPPGRRKELAAVARREAALHESTLLGDGLHADLRSLPLREPEDGEVFLMYFPISDHEMLGFGIGPTRLQVVNLAREDVPGDVSDAGMDEARLHEWSDRLLAPFAPLIEGARQIQVLPSFGLEALPFHALPWNGRPLLAHAAVQYSLDLPPGAVPAEGRLPSALVIGDPEGDLEDARREAEASAMRLRALGIPTRELVGRDAQGPEVRSLLMQVEHLHYAGHSENAGDFGWQAALNLADGIRIAIPDIFAVSRVPATVTLLSCRSGVADGKPRNQGIHLAAAFLIAGTRAVLASSAQLPAKEAPLVAAALYRALRPSAPLDLRSAYRSAMLRLLAEELPASTWQALRLWAP